MFLALPVGARVFPIQRTCLVGQLSFPQMISFIPTRTQFLWHMNLPQPPSEQELRTQPDNQISKCLLYWTSQKASRKKGLLYQEDYLRARSSKFILGVKPDEQQRATQIGHIILAPNRTDITKLGVLLLSGGFHKKLLKIILFAVEMVCSIISTLSLDVHYIKP